MDRITNMDAQTVSNIKTFIIVALIVLLFLKMTRTDYIVIENKTDSYYSVSYDGFKTLDNINQISKGSCPITNCNNLTNMYGKPKPNSFVRTERYTTKTSENNKKCMSPLNTCDKRWDVSVVPGANGTCSDKLWHNMEPKTILTDNCLHCNDFQNTYIAPSGHI